MVRDRGSWERGSWTLKRALLSSKYKSGASGLDGWREREREREKERARKREKEREKKREREREGPVRQRLITLKKALLSSRNLSHSLNTSGDRFLNSNTCFRERSLHWQPTGPNPLHQGDDFSRPALRHVSLNSHFPDSLTPTLLATYFKITSLSLTSLCRVLVRFLALEHLPQFVKFSACQIWWTPIPLSSEYGTYSRIWHTHVANMSQM